MNPHTLRYVLDFIRHQGKLATSVKHVVAGHAFLGFIRWLVHAPAHAELLS